MDDNVDWPEPWKPPRSQSARGRPLALAGSKRVLREGVEMRALAYVGARQSKVGDASRHHAHGVGDQLVASRDTTAAKHPLTLMAVARSAPSTGAPLLLCAKALTRERPPPQATQVSLVRWPASGDSLSV